ncbi:MULTISPECIES: hypothetical protein [Bacillus]|uniref:NADH dehydrogenase n=4 Tax=Bacillus cereus group TaxID=86661 RepID=A0A9X0T8S7_BACCE|nr:MULTISPECIES: hypothetical protein [Bacillus]EEK75561.1 NADH dehydrogenase subunit 6 [Bacillus cereus R309803]EEL84540.1 NADH dehydrogenase subunit 6 [Bacillus cereus AH1272]EEL90176.1 NADH dehydrogenase subunit 6 [Bacillus cereus AH1273]KXY71337.1 NADH dehydrogenase [Bacillus wiedmannii]MDV8115707.1 hypothetical protein [Bacillus sp. BAU-SS-2023]CJC62494.1 Uncharacterised protein [Streptococcus pneumoniae]HDR7248558.1 hypothetical protein [Bacillus pacificus]
MTNFIDLEELALILKINSSEIVERIVKQYTMDSKDIMDRFEISKQRLLALKKQGVLKEIKKGIFIIPDAEEMRKKQVEEKRLQKYSNYDLTPAYKKIEEDILIVNKLRFFDCLTMVNKSEDSMKYNKHLESTLHSIYEIFKDGGVLYFTLHKGFDEVENLQELKELEIIQRKFTKNEFIKFLESVEMRILGIQKVLGFVSILNNLKTLK